jgi:hypothetical protein
LCIQCFRLHALDIVLVDGGKKFYFNLTSMPSTTAKPVDQGVGKRLSPGLGRGDGG